MKEVWKDIEGYEGLYQISSMGRVKSLPKTSLIQTKYSYYYRATKEMILKADKDKYGYEGISISSGGIKKRFTMHRLVAKAFISNPNNYTQINHKDENKLNNCVDNLEWCTVKYNNNYGAHNIKISQKLKGKKISDAHKQKIIESRVCTPVFQLDKRSGTIIKEYASMKEAEMQTGIFRSAISACCIGKCKSAGGYKWKYKYNTI